MAWVILGHTFLQTLGVVPQNPEYREKVSKAQAYKPKSQKISRNSVHRQFLIFWKFLKFLEFFLQSFSDFFAFLKMEI